MKIIIQSSSDSLTYHCETHTDSRVVPFNVDHLHAIRSTTLRDLYQKYEINFGTKEARLTQEEQGGGKEGEEGE